MQVDLWKAMQKLMAAQGLQAIRAQAPFAELHTMDQGLRDALDPYFDWTEFGKNLLQSIPRNTLLIVQDTFGLRFLFFQMPGEADAFYIIGPWVRDKRDPERQAWLEKNLSEEALSAVNEYYNALRQLENEGTPINIVFSLLSTLDVPDGYKVERQNEYLPLRFRPETGAFEAPVFREDMPIAELEQRYAAETHLMDAVRRGDEMAAFDGVQQMRRFSLGGRFEGSLYARKTKLVVLNTLLRKAIQQSQVHPYYIDKISARYSLRVENMTAEEENAVLHDMVRDYCAYVRRYSLKQYSPMVQKVINHINLNLSEDLSLKNLAARCFITPSYLSNLFKQETGSTLTDYVTGQRMHQAAYWLRTTELGISAVAERVGILDVNYFAKMFKRSMGNTPSQYRRQSRVGVDA